MHLPSRSKKWSSKLSTYLIIFIYSILVAELNQLHVTKPSKKSIDEKVKRNIVITFQKLHPTCLRFSWLLQMTSLQCVLHACLSLKSMCSNAYYFCLYQPHLVHDTAQKIKFSIKDFFSKCDQIGSLQWIWSPLLKKSLMEDFIFCAVR